jgi:rRNA maturation RNase YbeY
MTQTPHIVEIRTTVRSHIPSVPYEDIARHILGERYQLSLVICGDTLARNMNVRWRKKTYSPNVLSFPYDEWSGEVILNVRKAGREARAGNVSVRDRLGLLFVHACHHLKGLDHCDEMDRLEAAARKRFGFGN